MVDTFQTVSPSRYTKVTSLWRRHKASHLLQIGK